MSMYQAVYWQPGMKMGDVEKLVIEAALRFFQGDKTRAAESLGMHPAALKNKIVDHDIRSGCLKVGTGEDE